MNKQILIALLTASLLLTACTSGETPSDDSYTPSDASGDTSTAGTEEYVYPYPSEGFGGKEFRILNIHNLYTFHNNLDLETITGDVLDDAIYNRNRLVERKLDIVIKQTIVQDNWPCNTAVELARASIMADDDQFDVTCLLAAKLPMAVADGYFLNLYEVENLQLDQPWWYQSFNNALTLDGILYSAAGQYGLSYADAISMITFNKDKLENYKLELPYDLVREGKWTLDALNEYTAAVASLNGDDSASWNKNGNTFYGFSNGGNNILPWLIGCGESFIGIEDDTFVLNAGSDRWYNVVDKMTKLFTQDDAKFITAYNGNDRDPDQGGYIYLFEQQRALFAHSEINKLHTYRDLNFEYGVLPYPKHDENQDQYYSTISPFTVLSYTPSTVRDPGFSGLVLDALAYEGSLSVMPIFRELTVEQKGLRDDDSIEMLELIEKTVIPRIDYIFQIGTELDASIRSAVFEKSGQLASAIDSSKPVIEAKAEAILKDWNS